MASIREGVLLIHVWVDNPRARVVMGYTTSDGVDMMSGKVGVSNSLVSYCKRSRRGYMGVATLARCKWVKGGGANVTSFATLYIAGRLL